MKELIIFDMAGTTINDRDEVYRVLREATERTGARYSDAEFQQLMGTEKKYAIEKLMSIGGVEISDAAVNEAWEWFRDELRQTYELNPPTVLPGVEEALNTLRESGIKIGLTTGFSREITDVILYALGWAGTGIIDSTAAGDEVPAGRPEPYLIQKVMEDVGVTDPAKVLSVGDTEADIRSAQKAGVMSAGVLTGHLSQQDFEELGADAVLESVAEFTNLELLK